MNAASLPSGLPLAEPWREVLESVAKDHGLASGGAALADAVRALSRVYNGQDPESTAKGKKALAARLGFSFPRDAPKAALAVGELISTGLLSIDEAEPLRLLDVGAGLGAMTFGVALALALSGGRGLIQASWVDPDAEATRVGESIVKRASAVGEVTIELAARKRAAEFDLVMVGQALSEMDEGVGDDERAKKHADLLGDLLASRVAPEGALVVVEPALRDRTRHLHRVRDLLVARSGVTLFSPCLHSGPCPALANPSDWCHEDRAVNLPEWLAPTARAAGLRWEGLTYSYLVLRRDGRTLRSELGHRGGVVRVVSSSLVSKGKRELLLCGDLEGASGRARAFVLDREKQGREAWDHACRGELLEIVPPLSPAGGRIRLEKTAIRRA